MRRLRWIGCGVVLAWVLAGSAKAQMTMAMPAVGTVSAPAKGTGAEALYQSAGTKKMAERLQGVFAGTDFRLDPNKAGERVRYYSDLLRTNKLALEQDTSVREQLAREMLYVGDSEGAVRQLAEVRRRWGAAKQAMSPELAQETGRWLAMAYLRIGEQGELRAYAWAACVPVSAAKGRGSPDA